MRPGEFGQTTQDVSVESRTYVLSGAVFATALYLIPLLQSVSLVWGGEVLSSFLTGGILFGSVLTALGLMVVPGLSRLTSYQILGTILLIIIVVIWTVVSLTQDVALGVVSEFDVKRPYLFVQGFFLAGLVGIVAAGKPTSFLRGMFLSLFVGGTVLSLFYSLLYLSQGLQFYRLGDASSLYIGRTLNYSAVTLLAVLFLPGVLGRHGGKWSRRLAKAALPFMVAGVVVSGTRAALLGLVVSALGFGLFLKGSAVKGRYWLLLFLVAAIVATFSLSVPDTVFLRFFQSGEGIMKRLDLLEAAKISFEQNPFGRTSGYFDILGGVNYAHNFFVQYLLETGVLGIIPLAVIVTLALSKVIRLDGPHHLLIAFCLLFLDFLIQAFSSASMYNGEMWFGLMFFMCLRPLELKRFNPGPTQGPIAQSKVVPVLQQPSGWGG